MSFPAASAYADCSQQVYGDWGYVTAPDDQYGTGYSTYNGCAGDTAYCDSGTGMFQGSVGDYADYNNCNAALPHPCSFSYDEGWATPDYLSSGSNNGNYASIDDGANMTYYMTVDNCSSHTVYCSNGTPLDNQTYQNISSGYVTSAGCNAALPQPCTFTYTEGWATPDSLSNGTNNGTTATVNNSGSINYYTTSDNCATHTANCSNGSSTDSQNYQSVTSGYVTYNACQAQLPQPCTFNYTEGWASPDSLSNGTNNWTNATVNDTGSINYYTTSDGCSTHTAQCSSGTTYDNSSWQQVSSAYVTSSGCNAALPQPCTFSYTEGWATPDSLSNGTNNGTTATVNDTGSINYYTTSDGCSTRTANCSNGSSTDSQNYQSVTSGYVTYNACQAQLPQPCTFNYTEGWATPDYLSSGTNNGTTATVSDSAYITYYTTSDGCASHNANCSNTNITDSMSGQPASSGYVTSAACNAALPQPCTFTYDDGWTTPDSLSNGTNNWTNATVNDTGSINYYTTSDGCSTRTANCSNGSSTDSQNYQSVTSGYVTYSACQAQLPPTGCSGNAMADSVQVTADEGMNGTVYNIDNACSGDSVYCSGGNFQSSLSGYGSQWNCQQAYNAAACSQYMTGDGGYVTASHNTTGTGYSTSDNCMGTTANCYNTSFQGSVGEYANQTNCQNALAVGCTWQGAGLNNSDYAYGYAEEYPMTSCSNSVYLQCQNGTMVSVYGPSFTENCYPPAGCTWQGAGYNSGDYAYGYEADYPAGACNNSIYLQCQNGSMVSVYSQSFYESCTESYADCTWRGSSYPHGSQTTGYTEEYPAGACSDSTTIQCDNGSWFAPYGGSYYENCTPSYADCTMNGNSYPSGTVLSPMYQLPNDDCNNPVSNECFDGNWNYPTYTYTECHQQCYIDGQYVQHNDSVLLYQYNAAPSPGDCVTQSRTCIEGTLDGDPAYQYFNCAEACTLDGSPLMDGQSATAYRYQNAPYPGDCIHTETRSCSNGTLSGSYEYRSCNEANTPECD